MSGQGAMLSDTHPASFFELTLPTRPTDYQKRLIPFVEAHLRNSPELPFPLWIQSCIHKGQLSLLPKGQGAACANVSSASTNTIQGVNVAKMSAGSATNVPPITTCAAPPDTVSNEKQQGVSATPSDTVMSAAKPGMTALKAMLAKKHKQPDTHVDEPMSKVTQQATATSASANPPPVQSGAGPRFQQVENETEEEEAQSEGFILKKEKSAFLDVLLERSFVTKREHLDLTKYLDELTVFLSRELRKHLNIYHAFKFDVQVKVRYHHPNPKKEENPNIYLRSGFKTVGSVADIDERLTKLKPALIDTHVNLLKNKSSMTLLAILRCKIKLIKWEPLAGAGYKPLPKYLQKKLAIINVENKDNRCFGYAVLAALNPISHAQNPQRPSNYDPLFARTGLNQIAYPVAPSDVPAIEDKLQVNINLFSFYDEEGRSKHPYYLSPKQYPQTIDLLYWDEHYACIRSFSRFASDSNKHKHYIWWCRRCMTHFHREYLLQQHEKVCEGPDFCKQYYTLPPWGKKLKFTNTRFQLRLPFAIYADFEALNVVPPAADKGKGKTLRYQKQVPCSVAFKLISTIPELQKPLMCCSGENCVQWFLKKVTKLSKQCLDYLFDEKRMIMTAEDDKKHADATNCYLCGGDFTNPLPKHHKVRDHDHFTGKYRGAAHSNCNLALRRTYKVPVFFHNFRGYDSHIIAQGLADFKDEEINVIGQGMEKYLSLSLGKHLVFKDSLMFLPASLERLGKNLLACGREKFQHLLKEFAGTAPEKLELILRKGVYPYDYMDCWDRFKETTLPPKAAFYNKLRGGECSDEDYAHAQRVWREFECKTLQDYHDIYLKSMVRSVLCLVFPQHFVNRIHFC